VGRTGHRRFPCSGCCFFSHRGQADMSTPSQRQR
jgi:hypothetical protein